MRKTKGSPISLLWISVIGLCVFALGAVINVYEDRQIHYVETHITLTKPVGDYDRYYALTAGELRAVYVGHLNGRIHKVFFTNLPAISDGGCGVVEVSYNWRTKAIIAECHGDA